MCKAICRDSQYAKNIGLLVLRVGIGLIFMRHGIAKMLAGTELWTAIGSNMSNVGIHFAPTLWGFAAACAEALGGICLVLGFGTRIAASFMAFVMFIAAVMHYTKNDAWAALAHPLSLLVVFISLVIMGSGIYSLDSRVCERKF